MEDRPKVNKLAIVSLVLGLVAAFFISIILFIPLEISEEICFPILAIGPIAAIVGVLANSQIIKSEGSERGSEIAWAGIALGVVTPVIAFFDYMKDWDFV